MERGKGGLSSILPMPQNLPCSRSGKRRSRIVQLWNIGRMVFSRSTLKAQSGERRDGYSSRCTFILVQREGCRPARSPSRRLRPEAMIEAAHRLLGAIRMGSLFTTLQPF